MAHRASASSPALACCLASGAAGMLHNRQCGGPPSRWRTAQVCGRDFRVAEVALVARSPAARSGRDHDRRSGYISAPHVCPLDRTARSRLARSRMLIATNRPTASCEAGGTHQTWRPRHRVNSKIAAAHCKEGVALCVSSSSTIIRCSAKAWR